MGQLTELARECSPLGLMDSPEGYPHVWAQDNVIVLSGDGKVEKQR